MADNLTPAAFVAKWKRTKLSERAASQEHFLDLCRLLDQPTPAEHDATGAEYTFEKGIAITAASATAKKEGGFADVWWKDKFGWEYKRKDKYKTLDEAYAQLQRYREALSNPPLLIVSDITTIQIHTNFTNTANEVHEITFDDILDGPGIDKLRRVFLHPESFKPAKTTEQVTLEVATQIGKIAQRLQKKHDPHAVAHFLMKCMFCLFAERVPGLLPDQLFHNLLNRNNRDPERFTKLAHELFTKMATGGNFGLDTIPYFNGGLFDDAPPIELSSDDLGVLDLAANQDWAHIEPSILGTLFERSLDPSKRAQIGAHYTSKEDILLVINPVIMDPLRKEWSKLRQSIEAQLETPGGSRRLVDTPQVVPTPSSALGGVVPTPSSAVPGKASPTTKTSRSGKTTTQLSSLTTIHQQISHFLANLSSLKILDPACGSGNFLYVAIQQLLSLEKEVITFAAQPPISLRLLPRIRPTQLLGIEINPYAAELAQVSIWIGFLQWLHLNGFPVSADSPILSTIQTIENRDAILDFKENQSRARKEATPPRSTLKSEISNLRSSLVTPAQWPDAHFIIGNPPFLGSKLFRASGLPDEYVRALYAAYDIPRNSDLCCYWFELARRKFEMNTASPPMYAEISLPRMGLLATQGIRGDDNRAVLERIKKSGEIFTAWSDKEWVLDGAAVNVSIIAFARTSAETKVLDGNEVQSINADLTANTDYTTAKNLPENRNIYRRPPEKGAKFEVELATARKLLAYPNPNGRPSSDVVRPWINGEDLVGGRQIYWIIDFPNSMPQAEAAKYEKAFEYAHAHVKKFRDKNADPRVRKFWWQFRRSGDGIREAVKSFDRILCTSMVAKHRVFTWLNTAVLPDKTITPFARSDDYFFGVLQSSVHCLWALQHGTQLEDRPRYTPTTTFETFPLPWPPGKEKTKHPAYKRIAAAAKELNDLRERWLNPPELLKPLAQILDATDQFLDVPKEARPLLRHSALMAQAAQSPNLKKRTLTNLYNERPTWLKLAHEKLDRATLAAYASIDPEGHWSEEWATLYTETGAGTPLPPDHPQSPARLSTDQKILTNLLRLNHQRSANDAS